MKQRILYRVIVLLLVSVVGWFSFNTMTKEKETQNKVGVPKKAHHHAHHGCECEHCSHALTSSRLEHLTAKQLQHDSSISVIQPAPVQLEYKNKVVPMIRQRAVSVNSLVDFNKELVVGDKIRLDFFPDAVVEGRIVKTHQNITGTFGYVAEDKEAKNLLFVTENKGRILATVVGEYAAYRLIYSSTTKSHHAIEMDLEAAPKGVCGCDDEHHDHGVEALFADPNADELNVADANLLSGLNQGSPITHIVDYMCVYSTQSKEYAETNASGIYNVITQALLKANDAHEASNTKTQLRLVHTREFAYDDTANNVSKALKNLRVSDDGILDEIHTDREKYKADLVSFLIFHYKGGPSSYTAGLASTPYFQYAPQSTNYKNQAFSVVEVAAATGYTFAHEIGHNFGCQHARDVFGQGSLQSPNPANTFSPAAYGYTIDDNGVNRTTIMGYTTVNNNRQLPYFSNPSLTYNSIAIGSSVTPKADNAGVIRDITADYVANYNVSNVKDMAVTSPTTGASLAAEASITVTWTNSGVGTVKIELYKANTLVHTFTTSTPNDGTESITLPANLAGSNHYQILVSRTDVDDTLPGISVDFTILGKEVFPLANGTIPTGWTQSVGTDKAWVVTTTDVNEGRYSINSNNLDWFENAGIEVTKRLGVGDVKFDYKVSLTSGHDQKLKFFVNGTEVVGWEGNTGWKSYTHHITTVGTYTLKWVANREGNSSGGFSEEAWLDNIVLPDNVNQVPVAQSDTYRTTPGTLLTVNSTTGVLKNDIDDGTMTAVLGMTTSHGTLNLASDGSFTYTPTNGYTGADSFTYTATDGTLSSSVVAVDILVTTPINTFPYTEGFDSGFGAWLQGASDDFDWTRNKGATRSRGWGNQIGPAKGKGGKNDYYLYAMSHGSDPHNYPNKTTLLTAAFDLSELSDASLNFNYHMYGFYMGKLAVEVKDSTSAWTEVWSKSGEQGDNWLNSAPIDLTAYAGKSKVFVRFRGQTGKDSASDIAIDSIALSGEGLQTPAFGIDSSIVGHNLNWTVDYEDGVNSYRIEKLVNGTWIYLQSVTAIGKNGAAYSVEIEDANATYRIVSVDVSGLTQAFSVGAHTVNLTLKQGWNLLSTPFANSDTSSLDGQLWIWDGEKYELVTTPEAKSGFWYYSAEATEVSLSGTEVLNSAIALNAGWNLIGPTVNMKAPATDKLYTWESSYIDLVKKGNYMIKGRGYWIYRGTPSELTPVK